MTDAPDDAQAADADERALVRTALSSGNDAEAARAAFEELIPLYARRVHAVAFALLGDRAEAEDAILFADVRVGADASVRHAILDEGVRVGAGAQVGAPPRLTLVPRGKRVAPGERIGPEADAPAV